MSISLPSGPHQDDTRHAPVILRLTVSAFLCSPHLPTAVWFRCCAQFEERLLLDMLSRAGGHDVPKETLQGVAPAAHPRQASPAAETPVTGEPEPAPAALPRDEAAPPAGTSCSG